MNAVTDDFTLTLADAIRVLALGQALSPATTGTLSKRTQDGLLLGELRAEDDEAPYVVAVDGAGSGGNRLPVDAVALHGAVLRARPGAGGVALVRSPRLAAWGLSGRAIPVRYFQMFGYTRAEHIPVAAPDPDAVEAVLAANPDAPALLLTDGRTLIWAPQPARAARLVLSLEEAAHVTALADQLGGAKDYPAEAREKIYFSLQAQSRR